MMRSFVLMFLLTTLTTISAADEPSNADNADPDDKDVTTSDPTESVFTTVEEDSIDLTSSGDTDVQIGSKGDASLNPMMNKILSEMNPLSMKEVKELKSGNADDYVSFLLRAANRFLPSKINLESVDSKHAYNCTLSGLEKGIHLDGNSFVEILDGGSAVFQFNVTTNNLTVNCKWKKTILYLFSLNGSVEAEFEAANIYTQMEINFMEDDRPYLRYMYETNFPDLAKINVEGAWILDCVGEWLLRSTFNGAKVFIESSVVEGIYEALERILNRMSLPKFKNDMNWLTMKDILTDMESN